MAILSAPLRAEGHHIFFVKLPRADSHPKTGEDSQAEESSTFSYILVGECYMHGMMDGEMMNLGKLVEDFIIS